jgi:DNA-binding winged helix-turn-helix (wHTH) protein/class 3 adenylate cyclase
VDISWILVKFRYDHAESLLLKRYGGSSLIYEFDQFRVDTTAFEVTLGGERLEAQPQVIELLILLLSSQDEVVSRDDIFAQVWKGRVVSDTALSSRIKSLRQLLGDDGETQRYIRTIHGRGFRFVGDAKTIDLQAASNAKPRTRYAKSGNIHIAYQVYGDGPVNLVIAPGFVSHIENYWDSPEMARWLSALGRHATVALFDKRGTGLSDSVSTLPGMDERMDDVRAVMDAVGWDNAFIMGISEGGSLAALFAAAYPQRCLGVILYGAFAQFKSWHATDESLQQTFDYIETLWGTGVSLPYFAPSVGEEPDAIEWWGKFERLGGTPGAAIALMTMNSQIDISKILSAIRVPALVVHRTEDVLIDFEGGQFLADHIPNAQLFQLPGLDHLAWFGDNTDQITTAIGDFLAGEAKASIPDTVLTTVLCVKVTNARSRKKSESKFASDEWLDAANKAIGHRLNRFRGREITSQNGFQLATFDGPARAMHCALDIIKAMADNQLSASIGLHTGEASLTDDGVTGPPVDMALQIASMASDDQALITSTVKDLTAGSGIQIDPVKSAPGSDQQQLFQINWAQPS